MELRAGDLLLRTVAGGDASEVARMWKFEQGSIPLAEARGAIKYMRDNHARNRARNRAGFIYHLCLAVYEKGENSIIGWCGLDGKPEPGNPERMEIFFLIGRAHRNKGYATQCALGLLEYAFEVAKIGRVFGGCGRDNISSFKVMSKSGMVFLGAGGGGDPRFFIDRDIYGKVKIARGSFAGG